MADKHCLRQRSPLVLMTNDKWKLETALLWLRLCRAVEQLRGFLLF